jgi:hypothetical protein
MSSVSDEHLDMQMRSLIQIFHKKYGVNYDELVQICDFALQKDSPKKPAKSSETRKKCTSVYLDHITIDEEKFLYDPHTQYVYTYSANPEHVGRYSYDLGILIRDA